MRKITIALVTFAATTLPLIGARNITAAESMVIVGLRQDPADAVWRAGRTAINNGEWQKAVEAFRRIRTETSFKTSAYRAQSYYWEAYARAQMGGSQQLRQARTLLATLRTDYPDDAKNIRDASSLLASVQGRLSKDYGDEAASADILDAANKLTGNLSRATEKLDRATSQLARSTDKLNGRSSRNDGCPENDDDNPRMAALNALMQMDAESAMPILEKVMARRDACSGELRARALWLIAQKKTPRSADILLEAIKSDPDPEVKQQAVYWLSQVDSDKALVALEDILRNSKDEDLQQNALFALAQNKSARANQMLREYAMRNDIPADVRANAIHWLGQSRDDSNYAFLRDMFGKVADEESKERIIYAISQRNSAESAEWLMNIVMDDRQPTDIRNQALYWAANTSKASNAPANALTSQKMVALYDKLTNQEMKQQLIYVYAQQKDPAFVDKLMDIAKTDKNAELRTTAIYWLGQVGSKDPRVLKFLADLING
jgi:HEAT repeat protein